MLESFVNSFYSRRFLFLAILRKFTNSKLRENKILMIITLDTRVKRSRKGNADFNKCVTGKGKIK